MSSCSVAGGKPYAAYQKDSMEDIWSDRHVD